MVGNFIPSSKSFQLNAINNIQSLQTTYATVQSHSRQLQHLFQQYASIQQEIVPYQTRFETIQHQLDEQKQIVYELSSNQVSSWNQQKQIIHYHLQSLQTGKERLIGLFLTDCYLSIH